MKLIKSEIHSKKDIFLILMLAFGYCIDFFDLTIFPATRQKILATLNVPESQILSVSTLMFNAQSAGFVLGSIIFGILGDKMGRMFPIRAGVFLYSSTILAHIFVHTVPLFTTLRFLSGVGLASEFASSIVFISEIHSSKIRAQISGFIYFFGVIGGLLATILGYFFEWKNLFIIASISGFILLALRISYEDSQMLKEIKKKYSDISFGSLTYLLGKKNSIKKLIFSTLSFLPFWFMVYFVNFAPELTKQLNINFVANQSSALCFFLAGSLLGAHFFPFLAIFLMSRKKSIMISFFWILITTLLFLMEKRINAFIFYSIIFNFGFASGYAGLGMTFVTESFGTNQRSTASCLIGGLARSSLIGINFLVPFLIFTVHNLITGILLSITLVFMVSFFSLYRLKETDDVHLDFIE